MKSSKSILAIAAMALLGYSASATNSINPLSEKEWEEMNQQIELDNMLDFDINPAEAASIWRPLKLDLIHGSDSHFNVNAEFKANETVGVVIIDEEGEIVHHERGLYKDVKTLDFDAYYNMDQTYVVRVYSNNRVQETSVSVVYR